MKRTASAAWTGGLKAGKGSLSTESGVLSNAQYGFKTRFEAGVGTNPEELIAAAHAGCFTMALAAKLEEADMPPESLRTEAAVTLDKVNGAYTVTAIHLDLVANIPGADQAGLERIAGLAKTECPISRLLRATITLTAKLAT